MQWGPLSTTIAGPSCGKRSGLQLQNSGGSCSSPGRRAKMAVQSERPVMPKVLGGKRKLDPIEEAIRGDRRTEPPDPGADSADRAASNPPDAGAIPSRLLHRRA